MRSRHQHTWEGGRVSGLLLDLREPSLGGFSTRSFSDWPNAADVSLGYLREELETGDVPSRYFLSPMACRGILRRAEKRGKELPTTLRLALKQVASGSHGQGT